MDVWKLLAVSEIDITELMPEYSNGTQAAADGIIVGGIYNNAAAAGGVTSASADLYKNSAMEPSTWRV